MFKKRLRFFVSIFVILIKKMKNVRLAMVMAGIFFSSFVFAQDFKVDSMFSDTIEIEYYDWQGNYTLDKIFFTSDSTFTIKSVRCEPKKKTEL